MTGFRGSDEQLEQEIAALEGIVRVRLRRTTKEFAELERELRELARERARRKAGQRLDAEGTVPVSESSAAA
jgi:hypothetical protein